MKAISVHVPSEPYEELKSLAARRRRPVAALLREAMVEYLERAKGSAQSALDLPPHPSGAMKKGWTRSDLLDEMVKR